MGITEQELAGLAAALELRLVGTVLQEVRQAEAGQLRLGLRRPGESLYLHFCLDPELPFAGLAPDHGASRHDPEPLVLKLRADLTGALLTQVRSLPGQRVLELTLLQRGRGDVPWTLSFRAYGRRPSLTLARGEELVLAMPVRAVEEPPRPPVELPAPGRRAGGASDPAGLRDLGVPGPEDLFTIYQQRLVERRLELRRANLERALRRALDKTLRLLQKLQEDDSEAQRRLEAGRLADLLKPSLHLVKPGVPRVQVLDWANDCQEVWLELDPRLSPAKNLERLYREFKKGKTALRILAERRAAARLRVDQLEQAIRALAGMSVEEMGALEGREKLAPRASGSKPARGPGAPQRALPWRVFAAASGREILVGRNAAGNSELTFREARPWDLWLHVRGAPGSHVVLRMNKGEELDQEALLDAAHLAAFYSDLRKDDSPEIIWAERRYLRPVKGKPGQVLVGREKVLQLRVDRARLERLGGRD